MGRGAQAPLGSEAGLTLPLGLAPEAEDDLRDAAVWYDTQQPWMLRDWRPRPAGPVGSAP